ncbi:DUF1800 family protein [Verrucomicrobium spinosum]|uniref:DUF1800 family protein n=1 Tax=Verrucomicrobium spinosum TaxID=2736 RepID=UPI0031B5AA46
MLAQNAFGKYRTILENVTYSPMMGIYLSHLKNQKANGQISRMRTTRVKSCSSSPSVWSCATRTAASSSARAACLSPPMTRRTSQNWRAS